MNHQVPDFGSFLGADVVIAFLAPSGGRVGLGEVVVEGVFGDEAAEAGLAEVVDPFPEFFDGVVEGVFVLVEEGEEHLLAALLVAPLAGGGGLAGELLDDQLVGRGVVDPVFAEAFVEGFEFLGAAEEPDVELVDLAGGAPHELARLPPAAPSTTNWPNSAGADGELKGRPEHLPPARKLGLEHAWLDRRRRHRAAAPVRTSESTSGSDAPAPDRPLRLLTGSRRGGDLSAPTERVIPSSADCSQTGRKRSWLLSVPMTELGIVALLFTDLVGSTRCSRASVTTPLRMSGGSTSTSCAVPWPTPAGVR